MVRALLLPFLFLGVVNSGCSSRSDLRMDPVTVGALLAETEASSALLEAIRQAIGDVNEAGVFGAPFQVVELRFTGDSDRQALTRDLYDRYGAVGFVSEFSATALRALNVTNQGGGGYEDFVQCSASSTNTVLNNPSTALTEADRAAGLLFSSDQNDTLYRGVSNDIKQARVVWRLVPEPNTTGVYFVDDAYGQSFRDQLQQRAADSASALAFVESFPAQGFAVDPQSAALGQILSLNQSGQLTSLIVVGLPPQGGPIVEALSAATPPFSGQIIVTDGAVQASFFAALGPTFAGWLGDSSNSLVGTLPENYAGENSPAWTERLRVRVPDIDLSDGFVTSAADCTYAIALAMLYAGASERYTAAAVKRHMPKLKQGYYALKPPASVVTVDASPAGLQRAQSAVNAGQAVRWNGASGIFVFDADGDRINQAYKTVAPVAQSDGWGWERVSVYDGDTGTCISGC